MSLTALDLLARLRAVEAAQRENMTRKAATLGLTVAQATVAQEIAASPGASLLEICRKLGWPKSSVSRLVDELVVKGLAVREKAGQDRRSVVLSLRSDLQEGCSTGVLETFFPGARGTLDPEELDRLIVSLDRLLELLADPGEIGDIVPYGTY